MHNLMFLGPDTKPKAYYSDNAAEIKASVVALGIPPSTSTPHIPQTNGIAENCVRKVSEGTACLLLQSGFSSHWWSDAMQCFCFSRNVTDLILYNAGSRCTPYQKRFGAPLPGLLVPFGAEIRYMHFEHGKVETSD